VTEKEGKSAPDDPSKDVDEPNDPPDDEILLPAFT